ncbi:substrate-binding domain-containing protein [Gordonia sp. CPCC 205515]|uniref:substrate-binding domain-containing protein n=1 Tax=Gordonia sp. CPCC 205515 TaxID=3140791 RepID=UPI003AF349D9
MARRIVADLEDTRSEMRRIRDGDRPIIRLACLPSLGPRICHLLADYCPQSTDTRWSLVTALRGPIVAGLRDGRFDLAVCESQADDDLLNSLLMHEPMRMILPANHPLTNRQPLRPSDVADIPYIGLHRSLGAANEAQRFFAAAELPPTPVVEVNDISLVPQLVTTISGYGFLPLSAAANSEEVAFVDTEPVLTRQISLTRIAKRSLSPAIVAFADYLTTQWNEQAMRQ